jgi:hypothetical protein
MGCEMYHPEFACVGCLVTTEVVVVLWSMSEGASSGEENANLYARGVNEGRAGELLDGEELLTILDVFGEDGLRS